MTGSSAVLDLYDLALGPMALGLSHIMLLQYSTSAHDITNLCSNEAIPPVLLCMLSTCHVSMPSR